MTPPSAVELFDTHMHLERGVAPDAGFAAARSRGVTRFLVAGGCLETCTRAARTAAVEDGVWAAAGVHPHDAKDFRDMGPFEELLRLDHVVAVGEIGLDYYYEHSDREVQKEVFRRFLVLAGRLQLPAIIHCRDAFDDCFDILQNTLVAGQQFEIHSFAGNPDQARLMLDLGAHLSYNGMVTFKRAQNIRESLVAVPLERLLVETDAPWLAPVPYRGKENQPAYVYEVAARIAQVRGISFETVARATTENGCRFFNV